MKKKALSRKTILRAAWIIYALISLIFWLPKIDQLLSKNYGTISQYVTLDDDWDITINDAVYHDVSLENFSFQPVVKGDRILMERTLPDRWPMTEGALRLHIRQAAIEILIDDEKVYEYGLDRIAAEKSVGSGLKFINFPTEYQGKNIKICLYVFENKSFTKLDSLQLYEWENAYRALVTEYRLPMLLGCFLIVFGILICIVTIFALAFSIKYLRIFCISLFSLFMGIWTLCYYNVISIFSIPLYSKSLLEYCMLYLCPLPLMIYMHEDVKTVF